MVQLHNTTQILLYFKIVFCVYAFFFRDKKLKLMQIANSFVYVHGDLFV